MADDQEQGGSWGSWMSDPANRAAMIQFGLQLSQPMAVGQNTLGHIGQAVGAGGEASDRVAKQELALREQGRREEETAQRGDVRAATADAALQRVQTQQVMGENQRLRQQEQGRIAAVNSYQQAKAKHDKLQADRSLVDPKFIPTPFPEFDDWRGRVDPQGTLYNGPTSQSFPVPPQGAVSTLREARQNPDAFRKKYGRDPGSMISEFDRKFGPGAAARALGGQ